MSRYQPVPQNVSFPELEQSILSFWEKERVFERSLEQRNGCPDWVFYDGPPGTNGLPHVGHMMQSALKDLWPRYKTMRGHRVIRRAGWDTHGLPVELKAEKELGIKDKSEIPGFGIERFQEHCRDTVFRFKDEWEAAIRRIGRFLDLEDNYATLTNDYIQTDWWVTKQIWDKGLLYKDYKIMPYCPRCGTTLSSHEVAQGYKDVVDLTLTARFELVKEPGTFFLAWTTTPWTLIGNVALALGPELDYVWVRQGDEVLVLAEALLEKVLGEGEHDVIRRARGSELGNIAYKPLWDFFAGEDREGRAGHFTVVDEYVTAEEGTGIVHLALYGEDDYRLIRKNDMPRVQHVDDTGCFTKACGQYAGRYFREEGLDVEILRDLAGRGLSFSKEKHTHSYPFCYKCDSPLMYHAKSSWFIRTTAVRDQLIRANKDINWVPGTIKEGRFGTWLENNVDWALSRERYWGSPLPVWTCCDDDCRHTLCVESLADLAKYSSEPVDPEMDMHVPWIDQVPVICPKCGKRMEREPYLLDCWFNAGLMPWGQWGYPAKPGSVENFESQFPADFICEGLDQTRGWFYTMLAVSTILTGQSSFRNVICTGLIADAEGRKMSKTFGNVVDPMETFEHFGADAVRWTFFNSNPWNAKRFSEDVIREAVKQVLIPYWNICSFFVTYASVDDWQPSASVDPACELDRWLMSTTERLVEGVEQALEAYDVFRASQAIMEYMDELSNWYIRRSRARFWKNEDDADKASAYSTLYQVVRRLTLVLAPFLPFVTEVIWQRVIRPAEEDAPLSVHLADWPATDSSLRDTDLERDMATVYHAVRLGRSLRAQHQIKVRQPLSKMLIVVGLGESDEAVRRMEHLIREELNVKQVEISRKESDLVELSLKPNFRELGKRYGKQMPAVAKEIGQWGMDEVARLEAGQSIEVLGQPVVLADLQIQRHEREGYRVVTEQGFTVALETALTPELVLEGLARELVNRVQNLRKESGLDVSDRIELVLYGSEVLDEMVEAFGETVCRETLAVRLVRAQSGEGLKPISLNDTDAAIGLTRVDA